MTVLLCVDVVFLFFTSVVSDSSLLGKEESLAEAVITDVLLEREDAVQVESEELVIETGAGQRWHVGHGSALECTQSVESEAGWTRFEPLALGAGFLH